MRSSMRSLFGVLKGIPSVQSHCCTAKTCGARLLPECSTSYATASHPEGDGDGAAGRTMHSAPGPAHGASGPSEGSVRFSKLVWLFL